MRGFQGIVLASVLLNVAFLAIVLLAEYPLLLLPLGVAVAGMVLYTKKPTP